MVKEMNDFFFFLKRSKQKSCLVVLDSASAVKSTFLSTGLAWLISPVDTTEESGTGSAVTWRREIPKINQIH